VQATSNSHVANISNASKAFNLSTEETTTVSVSDAIMKAASAHDYATKQVVQAASSQASAQQAASAATNANNELESAELKLQAAKATLGHGNGTDVGQQSLKESLEKALKAVETARANAQKASVSLEFANRKASEDSAAAQTSIAASNRSTAQAKAAAFAFNESSVASRNETASRTSDAKVASAKKAADILATQASAANAQQKQWQSSLDEAKEALQNAKDTETKAKTAMELAPSSEKMALEAAYLTAVEHRKSVEAKVTQASAALASASVSANAAADAALRASAAHVAAVEARQSEHSSMISTSASHSHNTSTVLQDVLERLTQSPQEVAAKAQIQGTDTANLEKIVVPHHSGTHILQEKSQCWTNRNYTYSGVGKNLDGKVLIVTTPYNVTRAGAVMKLTPSCDTMLYVFVSAKDGKDGGFRDSLPNAGYTRMTDARSTIATLKGGCCDETVHVWRKSVKGLTETALPVTTSDFVGFVGIRRNCMPSKSNVHSVNISAVGLGASVKSLMEPKADNVETKLFGGQLNGTCATAKVGYMGKKIADVTEQQECLAKCAAVDGFTACEIVTTPGSGKNAKAVGCYVHTHVGLSKGNGRDGRKCWLKAGTVSQL